MKKCVLNIWDVLIFIATNSMLCLLLYDPSESRLNTLSYDTNNAKVQSSLITYLGMIIHLPHATICPTYENGN